MRKFDPRCVLLAVFLLSLETACLSNIYATAAALLLGIIMLVLIRPNGVLKRLLAANVFIAFIWLFVPFGAGGEILWQWGILTVGSHGIWLALLITIKSNAIVCIFLSFGARLDIMAWSNGLHGLHCPEKLLWIFLLMGRNIFIFQNEWQKMTQAAKLRGFRAGKSPRTYHVIANMLAILLIRASDRGERMHEAMLLRGFCGKLPITENLRLTGSDYIFCVFTAAVMSLLACLELGLGALQP